MVSGKNIVVGVNSLSVRLNRRPILSDIDFLVSRGESIAITGPNGAGKSTLLLCLAGAMRPTHGKICCFDNAAPRSLVAKRLTGFAGHETGLYGELTVLENLIFAARMYQLNNPIETARRFLSDAGLETIENSRVSCLSQGARRRLAIVRATIHRPALILLDEPFASLDAEASNWLESLFQTWRHTERTVCFVSHDVGQSRRLADRIISLDSGRICSIHDCDSTLPPSRKTA